MGMRCEHSQTRGASCDATAVCAQKKGASNHDRSYHPDQGAQEQRMADAPRSHGERSAALLLAFSRARFELRLVVW